MRVTRLLAAVAMIVLWAATPVGAQSASVDVKNNEFAPKNLTITTGTTVTWTQSGTNPHSVTADDNSFDSHPQCPQVIAACMQAGQSFQQTFSRPGSVPYYCKVHGNKGGVGMAGMIVVQAAGGGQATPAPTPAPTVVRTTVAPRTAAPATARAGASPTPAATPAPTTPPPAGSPSPTLVAAATPPADDDGGSPALNIVAIGLGALAVIGAGIAALSNYLRRTRPPS